MSDAPLVPLFYLKIDGQQPRAELTADIETITVESSLHMPDVATITLHDQELRWADSDELSPGKPIMISAKVGRSEKPVFDGEVVEIEPILEKGMKKLVVRAFDRLHRLARGRSARRFVNITDGDLVKKLAGEVGLEAKTGPTPDVHPYVLQANQTNLDFLQARAAALGYLLYVTKKTLHYEPPGARGEPIALEWEKNLSEFRPRMSTVGQLNEVTARGWDPAQRREIVGKARTSKIQPKIGDGKSGGAVAKSAYSIEANYLITDRPLRTQSMADKLAQAVVDQHASRFIEAEGICEGNPGIVAGAKLEIKNVGKRFGGTYFVTGATHQFGPGQFETHFNISGLEPATLLSFLVPAENPPIPSGLVIGIVTDNNDPDKLGRVKLKFPWFASDVDTDWVRTLVVGGGKERGIAFLPEVNDEVLVGFELGDFNHPYVLGGLWNGQDKPPAASKGGYQVSGGKVQERGIRSRTGHTITFDDSDRGGGIEIKDKKGNVIKLDTSSDALKIEVKGDATITAQGNLSLESKGKIDIKGMGVSIDGGGGTVDVKGSMINLN
jgi:phage protein D